MAGMADIAGIQQTGVAVLAGMQDTLAKQFPTFSSGYLAATTLIQSGFVRVLGVSVISGTGSTTTLNDAATESDATTTNAIYVVSSTPGFYPVNLVFHKGLVLSDVGGVTKCAIMYSRI